jgi:predicted dehydrogenase
VELSRRKGRIGALGNMPLEVPHRPFYEKELQLRMSTSLGPGRYDPHYEVDGHDYPLPYVRWTERRNMEAFLDLVADGQVRAAELTTHHFPIDDAEKAYALIDGKIEGERPLGVRFDYPAARGEATPQERRVTLSPPTRAPVGTVRIGMVGAGPFARSVLLPALAGIDRVELRALSTATGVTGEREGKRHGFQYATTDYAELLADRDIDLVVLATPHAAHARMVVAALEAGKHVFVEKPLATRPEELEAIRAAWEKAGTVLHVGFNRRFSPFVQALCDHFRGVEEPLFMLYRVNAGYAPAGNEQQRQGGRIVGEGCHFIDTLVAITGERVERVAATSVTSHNASLVDADSTTIVLEHANGHLGTIHYLARGSSLLEKEYLEVHGGGRSAVLRDYRRLELYADGRPKTMWRLGQDKGHAEQLRQVVEAVRTGKPAPVPFEELLHVTEVSFEAAAQVGGLTNAD